MEHVNSIRFLAVITFLLMIMLVCLFNRIITDYESEKKQLLEFMRKIDEENYNLKVYKAKREFENKGKYD